MVSNSRSFLWDLLEKPWTSLAAQYYAMASLFVVFISTLTFVVSTVEDAKVNQDGEKANTVLMLIIEITGESEKVVLICCSKYPPATQTSCVSLSSQWSTLSGSSALLSRNSSSSSR